MCLVNVIVVFLAVCHSSFAIVDYCAQNTFATNNTWLQLNKEANSNEFAIDQHFKGLHCCAKGYRSIEWYKDGKPYPWAVGLSNFILYPESGNQTVYTGAVTTSDSGNYSCMLRNDTHFRLHTIQLKVFEKVPDAPRITFSPDEYQEVSLGSSVRLFCEAFLGRIDLPDAHNDAYWRRENDNATLKQETVAREDGNTLGVYLIINDVKKVDYGEYICRISKPDNQKVEMVVRLVEKIPKEYVSVNPIPWKKMLIISIIVMLVILTVVTLNLQYGMNARVYIKDRFEPLEINDGKTLDVLICYSQKDADIVLGVLLPKLESKFNYKCGSRELSSNVNNWHIEMNEAARKSRRVLCVMSPACFNEKWDATIVYQGMKQLKALGSQLNCIALKPLPTTKGQLKNDQGETLASILRTIPVINWDRCADDRNFWLSVRLQLPPKRILTVAQAETQNQANATRLNSNSHESLEILV